MRAAVAAIEIARQQIRETTIVAPFDVPPHDNAAMDGYAVRVADCLASANWLVKALDQRQKTIIKVASEIVDLDGKRRSAFSERGE